MLPTPPLYDYANEVTQGRMPQRRLHREVIPTKTKNGVLLKSLQGDSQSQKERITVSKIFCSLRIRNDPENKRLCNCFKSSV